MTKVLVVDDDTNICDLLKMYLEKEGYEVKTANDGVEGMTVFKMYEPDIVLLDKNNAKFDVNYKYFISLGMKETKIDNELVAKRVVRLEIKN